MRSADPELNETVLPNGIRVVTDRMPLARSVSSGVWVPVGGRDEPEHWAGASHFLEHLLFKGTADRSARSIAEDIDAVGGEMNAHTSREYTAFYTRLPDTAWRLGVDILGDIVSAPAFRPDELEAERQVIVEEILMSLDTPDDLVSSRQAEALFPGHPLGREVLGSETTVEAMTRDEISEFFGHWYQPANFVVAAAGNLDHEEFVSAVADRMAGAPGGARPQREGPGPEVEELVVEKRPIEQVHVAAGWRGFATEDPDRYALAVATQILGGGSASRLFQEIREDRGLAYTVYSYTSAYADAGAFNIYAATGEKRLDELLTVLDAEIERFLAEPVTERELEVAKGYLEGSTVLGLEDSGSRMVRVGRSLMSRPDVVPIDEHLARLRSVDAADVQRAAGRVFSGTRVLSAVGPVKAKSFRR